jgi:Domain of unknown function (DUF6457)
VSEASRPSGGERTTGSEASRPSGGERTTGSEASRPSGGERETGTSDLSPDALAWLDRFADALGVPVPSEAEIAVLLELAGTAAHASHRQAAPVACWLAAQARLGPADALLQARELDA